MGPRICSPILKGFSGAEHLTDEQKQNPREREREIYSVTDETRLKSWLRRPLTSPQSRILGAITDFDTFDCPRISPSSHELLCNGYLIWFHIFR